MRKDSIAAPLVVLMLGASPGAFAYNGSTSFASLFQSPTDIAIKNEVVKIDVGEKLVKVDCTCVFVYSGAKWTLVRAKTANHSGAKWPMIPAETRRN